MEIKLPKIEPIYGVILKGSPLYDQYVTSYKVLYSTDGLTFHYVEDDKQSPEILRGPIDSRLPVQAVFKHPIEAKIIKIIPLTWHDSIAIRAELLGCAHKAYSPSTPKPIIITTPKPTTTSKPIVKPTKPSIQTTTVYVEETMEPMCDDPMGVENGFMSPDQIKVSSVKPITTKTKVLPLPPSEALKLGSPTGWKPVIDSPNEYVLFDFLKPRNLTGVKTKGGDSGWVTAYNILYSPDNQVWNKVLETNGEPKTFLANFDGKSPKVNYFKYPIHAQYLKVVPTKWHNVIELKAEPLGCFVSYRKIYFTATVRTFN